MEPKRLPSRVIESNVRACSLSKERRFSAMERSSERTSDLRSQVDCGSGRSGVKGQDERQRTAPLTPPRPQKGFFAPRPGKGGLTKNDAVIQGAKAPLVLGRLRHGRKRCLSPLESLRAFQASLRGFGPILPPFPGLRFACPWALILRPLRGECLRAVFMPLGGPMAHGDTTEVEPFQSGAGHLCGGHHYAGSTGLGSTTSVSPSTSGSMTGSWVSDSSVRVCSSSRTWDSASTAGSSPASGALSWPSRASMR